MWIGIRTPLEQQANLGPIVETTLHQVKAEGWEISKLDDMNAISYIGKPFGEKLVPALGWLTDNEDKVPFRVMSAEEKMSDMAISELYDDLGSARGILTATTSLTRASVKKGRGSQRQ